MEPWSRMGGASRSRKEVSKKGGVKVEPSVVRKEEENGMRGEKGRKVVEESEEI